MDIIEKIKGNIPERGKRWLRKVRNILVDPSNERYYMGLDKIYLASADQFEGMKKMIEKKDFPQCENFFSVIGGMGGLNVLSRLKNLKSITFYDINPFTKNVAKLYIELIKNSKSRDEFISLIYARKFDSSAYSFFNQEEYYSLPIDNKLILKLKKILSEEIYKFYRKVYFPYIINPTKDNYSGVSKHCTRMLIYHEAKIYEPMTLLRFSKDKLKKNKFSSYNSFFFGKGWLKNEERFQNVKKNLTHCNVNIIIEDLYNLEIPKNSGLYASNIYGEFYPLDPFLAYKFLWILKYSEKTRFLKLEFAFMGERKIHFRRLYGENIKNPHKVCVNLLNKEFNMNKSEFLEVIFPHVKENMNFGFKEYNTQKKVSVNDFLKKSFNKIPSSGIIGVHILMGNGCSPETWKEVCSKAAKLGKKVFIFEHNPRCTDFPEWDIDPDNILEEYQMDSFLASLGCKIKKYGLADKKGNPWNIRNICWILEK